jgi:hypothetical protein
MAYNLDGYVTVAERLTQAHDQIVTVVTEPPILLTDAMGYIRATVALKDGRSATATASFRLDLQNRSAQATNPLEDCETSAIGRALGFLGYGSSKSVASREEVQEAQRRGGATFNQPQRPQAPAQPTSDTPPLCPVHKKPMRAGANGGYFCATKLGKDEQGKDMWCKARPEKPAPMPPPDTSEWDEIDNAPSVQRRRGAVVEESLL